MRTPTPELSTLLLLLLLISTLIGGMTVVRIQAVRRVMIAVVALSFAKLMLRLVLVLVMRRGRLVLVAACRTNRPALSFVVLLMMVGVTVGHRVVHLFPS